MFYGLNRWLELQLILMILLKQSRVNILDQAIVLQNLLLNSIVQKMRQQYLNLDYDVGVLQLFGIFLQWHKGNIWPAKVEE